MLEFDYQDLEDWSGGEWVNAPPGERVLGFSYDTRRLTARDMFVALKSPKRDGHNFINCLLYTSPSPRDRQKSRMPSSA